MAALREILPEIMQEEEEDVGAASQPALDPTLEEGGVDGLPRLPLDLLPVVLSHLSYRINDLAACARVNHTWHAYAQPLLYERIVLCVCTLTGLRCLFSG